MRIKTINKSKKTLIFSLVTILMTIVLLIPLFTTKPKSKDTTAEIQEQTITFSIDNEEFSANREMTWESWIDSEFNTEEYSIDENNYICNENGKLTRNSKLIMKNYYVIENAEYKFTINTYILNIEYEDTTLSYIFEQDMTWAEWLSSDYADDSIFSENPATYVGNGILINIGTWNEQIIYVLYNNTNSVEVLKSDLINSNYTYELILNITFEIENTTYSALNGWTWADFVDYLDSLDNAPITLSIDNDGHITDGSGFVSYNSTYVLDTDLIVENREYDIVIPTPQLPDPSQITNLTGTSWILNSDVYVNSQVDYYIDCSYNNATFSTINFKYYSSDGKNWKGIQLDDSYDLVSITAMSNPIPYYDNLALTITGGTDVTNQNLIDWLVNNATLISVS